MISFSSFLSLACSYYSGARDWLYRLGRTIIGLILGNIMLFRGRDGGVGAAFVTKGKLRRAPWDSEIGYSRETSVSCARPPRNARGWRATSAWREIGDREPRDS